MRRRAALAAGLVALVLAACGTEASPRVAATVNGDDIPISRVRRALEDFEKTPQFDQLVQQSDEGTAKRQFEQAFLAQQIQRAVLRPAAEEMGISVSADEIDQQIEQIKSQFPSEEEYNKALEDRGFTAAELEDLVEDQIVQEKIRNEITEESQATKAEVRDYYESNEDTYRQTRVQHILVKKADLARSISRQLRRARSGRVDALFAKLAKQHSTDQSNSKKAGELGWVAPGSLVPPFEKAMDSLSVGEISGPVRTEFGVHVLRVTGRRQQPFSDVSDEIEARLSGDAAEQAYGEWLRNAYEEADVEVNPRYGELDPSTGQITNAGADEVPGADESSQGSG